MTDMTDKTNDAGDHARRETDRAESQALSLLAQDGFALTVSGGLAGDVDLPKPYGTTITLVDRTYLVGGRGFGGSGADEGMLEGIRSAGSETRIVLRREPDDAADPWTVEASLDGVFLGVVRAHENEIIARLMDAGKHVYAEYLETETLGEYHRIWVSLVMED
ncbi:HIRAN domain-containing protein [Bifidobacterium stellenboschense]|uniref:Restriction endonuclease n=1 Tax=Bifidobacterium stellenboschense TaxID=762211 RepID=A0A087D978_9BIFI|nr:HIRAN domain-containing protein [Bifidobacterium stellenboschense]KFI92078.1 restriction endonuclease [Bifidobacterium stellenboschense]